jgi:hypothetical protein
VDLVLLCVLAVCLWIGWRDVDIAPAQEAVREAIRQTIRTGVQLMVQYAIPGAIALQLVRRCLACRRVAERAGLADGSSSG